MKVSDFNNLSKLDQEAIASISFRSVSRYIRSRGK